MNNDDATYAELRTLYRDAMNGDAAALKAILSNEAHMKLYGVTYSERRERASSTFWTVRAIVQIDGMRKANAAIRAAWNAGDMVAMLEAVKAGMTIDDSAWSVNHGTICGMWALAMTLRYGDRPAYVLDEARRKVPAYLDSLDRDTEHWAEERGVLCQIESRWKWT